MGHVRRFPHLPRALTQRHPWKQILGVWPPRRSGAPPAPPGLAWWVGAGGWRADVGSGGPAGTPPQPRQPPGERGAGLAFLGWGRKCAAILPLLLLLQDPKGECGRTQEGPPRGLGSLIFTLLRACTCATRAGPWELGSAWGGRGSAPSVPTTPHVPLQRGEKETFIYPQTKRWQGGQQRRMTTALLETTTSRPGCSPCDQCWGSARKSG